MFVAEEKKNGKGKGGKYFETENIFLQRRELKWRRKRKKIFGKGKRDNNQTNKQTIWLLSQWTMEG